jgi:catechol 2,3-dioxygenase-like lactoylglutathione lyase family enzyme
MPARIRHIALSVKDIDATADFYERAFGLKRSPKSEGPTAFRVYMSDGEINLALLQYKSEVGSGLKNPAGFVGIHHFGLVRNQPLDLSDCSARWCSSIRRGIWRV